MQKVKITDIQIKTGTNDKGAWTNTRITGDDNAVFGTFHKGASQLKIGDVIELEPIVKGKNINFDKFNVLESGPAIMASDSGKSGSQYKRDTEGIRFEYELKAYLQGIERTSIEAQTAFNGIVKLAEVAAVNDNMNTLIKAIAPNIWQKALEWAESKLAANMTSEAPQRPKDAPETSKPSVTTATGQQVDPSHPFANVGQFLQWAKDHYGLDRAKAMEIVGADEKTLPKINLADAHVAILDFVKIFGPEK